MILKAVIKNLMTQFVDWNLKNCVSLTDNYWLGYGLEFRDLKRLFQSLLMACVGCARVKVILIGGEDCLDKRHKEPRGNHYFVGEVFAVNNGL